MWHVASVSLARDQQNIYLRIYCMPSHMDMNPKNLQSDPDWMQPWHVAGSKEADILAGVVAE